MLGRHEDGAVIDVDRQLQMLDLDGVALPAGMSVVDDPEPCVVWAVDNLLPPEFREASFVYQMSCSAGMTKPDDTLSAHVWFFTDRPHSNAQLRRWGGWWNAKQQKKIIDTAVFNPVQPHYTNDPGLLDGLVDPLAGRRLRMVCRRRCTVRLYLPAEAELRAEGRLKVQRARGSSRRSYHTPSESSADGVADDAVADAINEQLDDEGADYVRALEAVQLGPGWQGYLNAVGFEGHIRTQIRAAIGSYFYENGSRADRRVLKKAIETAVSDSPFLDGGQGSRSRREALEYLSAPPGGRSNVDEMIADIAERQKFSEQKAYERCEPTWSLPTLVADEAFATEDEAVRGVVAETLRLRRDRLAASADDVLPTVLFQDPAKTAVLCEPGVGKTAAMISAGVKFLQADPAARVAIAVPTHHLGTGMTDRVNEAFGARIAAEWYGVDRPDPQRPDTKMCRMADTANDLIAAGGKLQLLCSSRNGGYCPHHPKVAGEDGCGYRRQQQPAVNGAARVWIVPATMLMQAPPLAMRRRGSPSDFDLLVIDEAPWFGMVAGLGAGPLGVLVDWLQPQWWAEQEVGGHGEQDRDRAIETFTNIYSALAGCASGPLAPDVFVKAGITAETLRGARRFVWRCKADLRDFVRPGASRQDLRRSLANVAVLNERVMKVAEVLQVIRMHLQGRLPPSGVAMIEASAGRFLQVRWRREIDGAWLKSPVLYLDAAGTGAAELARAWLPDLVVAAEARAKAP